MSRSVTTRLLRRLLESQTGHFLLAPKCPVRAFHFWRLFSYSPRSTPFLSRTKVRHVKSHVRKTFFLIVTRTDVARRVAIEELTLKTTEACKRQNGLCLTNCPQGKRASHDEKESLCGPSLQCCHSREYPVKRRDSLLCR